MIKSMTGFGRCEVQKDSEETEFLRDCDTDTFKVLCKQGQGGYLYYLRRSLSDTGVSEI